MIGLVIKNTGNHYVVRCEDGAERICLAKGNFRLKGIRSTSPIVVGDHVVLQLNANETQEEHYITEILDRRNYIVRRSINLSKKAHILAANIDTSFLICTVVAPETSTTFIDRFLATAEAYRIPTEIIFNKIDLYDSVAMEVVDELEMLYSGIGYPCHRVSAKTGAGIAPLLDRMRGKINLVSGHSGVGKSTLINALIPDANLRVGEISLAHLTGQHTTTYSQMIPLPQDPEGYLIDTPGIKGFGTLDMKKEEVAHYFPEFFARSKHCRFANCTHTHEPDCAILEGLEHGEIAPSRYISYESILTDNEDEKYRPEY